MYIQNVKFMYILYKIYSCIQNSIHVNQVHDLDQQPKNPTRIVYLLSYKLINNVSSMRMLFINNAQGTASFSFLGFIKSFFSGTLLLHVGLFISYSEQLQINANLSLANHQYFKHPIGVQRSGVQHSCVTKKKLI